MARRQIARGQVYDYSKLAGLGSDFNFDSIPANFE